MDLLMRDTLRLRMGWLHEWVGFIGGLILVIVFTGGSLAMFDTELTHWMQPELSRYPATPLSDEALNKIGSIAQEMRKEGENPFITLPTSRDPMLRILHYDGHASSARSITRRTVFRSSRGKRVVASCFLTFITRCITAPSGETC